MRLGCFAVLGALYLFWSGGQGLVTALTNREPARLDCASYGQMREGKEWLELTDCELNLLDASYTERGGRVVELFIPARGLDTDEDAPIHVLVATRDEGLLKVANDLTEIESDAELIEVAARHREELFVTRNVSGLVRYGVDLDDAERDELKSLDDGLAEGFVILDEGEAPGLGRPLGLLSGGLVLLLVAGAGLVFGSAKG